jgi:two-component system, OmpR family, alkaline phosphatase synthesis response regulator PhoP
MSTVQALMTVDPVRCVLVIDDSELIRHAAELALGVFGGLRVLTADSGERGIQLARSARPDAILLDVVMPGLDGFEVAERLLATEAGAVPPIVFLTASDSMQDRERLGGAAVAGLIAKPFDVGALAEELCALLGWSA